MLRYFIFRKKQFIIETCGNDEMKRHRPAAHRKPFN
jgi:hypothetical protein